MGLFDYLRYAAQNQPQPDYGALQMGPAAPATQPAQFTASPLSWQDQLAGAIDYGSSSGDAWGAIGRDGVINYMGDELQQQYGTRNLSDFRYVEDPGAPGGYRLDWAGRQPATGLVSALGDAARSMGITAGSDGGPLQAMNPSDALSFGATWEGEGGTNFNFFRKPDGSVGIKTGGQTSNETADVIAALAIMAGGYAAGTGALGGAASSTAATGAAEGAATGAATGAADIGMASFGQIGMPSAIPTGVGYGSLGATSLSAPVSTFGAGFGGGAIGSGMAGTLAGMGAGGAEAGLTNPFLEQPWSPTPGSTPLEFSSLPPTPPSSSGSPSGSPTSTPGTPPPANPYHPASYLNPTNLSNLATSGGASSLLGPAASVLGAISGGQGQEGSSSSTRAMDPRMDGLFYGDLAPRTQGLLGSTVPQAQLAGAQMLSKGGGLLDQTAPNTATNPYATGILDDLQRRQQEIIARSLQQTKGNSVAVGGLGGSRQGIAEADAITRGADNFTGQAANFMGGLYNADQNRLRQDWTIGSGLMTQGVNTPFLPAQNASQIYSPFTGFGTTTNNTQQGGGWQGAIGGALGAAQFGKNMGWW